MHPRWELSCIRADVTHAPAIVLSTAELKPSGRAARHAFTLVQLMLGISPRRSGNQPRRREENIEGR
eukprot:4127637-Pyramimonas_sp.AAC.1